MFLVEQRTTCEEEFVTGSTNKQQNIDGDGGFHEKQ
jgi:ribosomal protein L31